MGKSNFLNSLGTKLGYLKGELEQKREELGRAQRLNEAVPVTEGRIGQLGSLVDAAELLILNYHPEWDADTVDPVRASVHKPPIRIGQATRKALGWGSPTQVRTHDFSYIKRRTPITPVIGGTGRVVDRLGCDHGKAG